MATSWSADKAFLFQKYAERLHTFASSRRHSSVDPSFANFDEKNKFPVHQKRKLKKIPPPAPRSQGKTRTKKTCTNCFEMKTVSDCSLGL